MVDFTIGEIDRRVKRNLTRRRLRRHTDNPMIRSFRSRSLASFWRDGDASKFRADLEQRVRLRLSRLDQCVRPEEINVPGFNFHRLRGRPTRWSVHVNGPWCITFEWDKEDAVRVDLEQYH
jgi:toxin HigB-1